MIGFHPHGLTYARIVVMSEERRAVIVAGGNERLPPNRKSSYAPLLVVIMKLCGRGVGIQLVRVANGIKEKHG